MSPVPRRHLHWRSVRRSPTWWRRYNETMTTPTAWAPQQVVERFFQFSLLGMLASGYFAVLGSGYLDWPTSVLTLAALCLRALMIAGIVTLDIPGRVVAAITVLYIGF